MVCACNALIIIPDLWEVPYLDEISKGHMITVLRTDLYQNTRQWLYACVLDQEKIVHHRAIFICIQSVDFELLICYTKTKKGTSLQQNAKQDDEIKKTEGCTEYV